MQAGHRYSQKVLQKKGKKKGKKKHQAATDNFI